MRVIDDDCDLQAALNDEMDLSVNPEMLYLSYLNPVPDMQLFYGTEPELVDRDPFRLVVFYSTLHLIYVVVDVLILQLTPSILTDVLEIFFENPDPVMTISWPFK